MCCENAAKCFPPAAGATPRDAPAAKRCCKRIINALAAEHRILIGYEGPHASILKLRPPMPFRREHADLLVQAIDAAAADAAAER